MQYWIGDSTFPTMPTFPSIPTHSPNSSNWPTWPPVTGTPMLEYYCEIISYLNRLQNLWNRSYSIDHDQKLIVLGNGTIPTIPTMPSNPTMPPGNSSTFPPFPPGTGILHLEKNIIENFFTYYQSKLDFFLICTTKL